MTWGQELPPGSGMQLLAVDCWIRRCEDSWAVQSGSEATAGLQEGLGGQAGKGSRPAASAFPQQSSCKAAQLTPFSSLRAKVLQAGHHLPHEWVGGASCKLESRMTQDTFLVCRCAFKDRWQGPQSGQTSWGQLVRSPFAAGS